jgi:hypothetical protein
VEKKEGQRKELISEFRGFAERANKVVKHIKPVDISKVFLTSYPFAAKRKTVSLTK